MSTSDLDECVTYDVVDVVNRTCCQRKHQHLVIISAADYFMYNSSWIGLFGLELSLLAELSHMQDPFLEVTFPLGASDGCPGRDLVASKHFLEFFSSESGRYPTF